MSRAIQSPAAPDAEVVRDAPTRRALRIEGHGVDVIAESERHGRTRDQFWPWAGGNLTILAISMGGLLLAMGLNVGEALLLSTIGVAASFLLIGIEALGGPRGNAPTLVLSRAAFGVHGNAFSGVVGYLLMVGWETVSCSLAVLASRTVLARLGVHSTAVDVLVFAAVVVGTITLAIYGFHLIMAAQRWITLAVLVITVAYMALTWRHLHPALWTHSAGSGSVSALVGGFVLVLSTFGIGWATAGADYSRYLPRDASRPGLVLWSMLGGTTPVALLMVYGTLIAASNPGLAESVVADPIGALTTILPTWFLVPFVVVVVVGLIAAIPMNIYSSGLTLLAMGLPTRRWVAALIDGVMMTIGAIYVVWLAPDFLAPFEAFLYTVGVGLAAWTGIYLADLALRWRAGYDERKLFDASSRGYGSVKWGPLLIALTSSAIGLGLVTSSLGWLAWEGFLLGPLGLGGRSGDWAGADLGVLVALVVSAVGYWVWWIATGQSRRQLDAVDASRRDSRQPASGPSAG